MRPSASQDNRLRVQATESDSDTVRDGEEAQGHPNNSLEFIDGVPETAPVGNVARRPVAGPFGQPVCRPPNDATCRPGHRDH
jgi:hypothetical protein